jgi:hypothetical protein
MIRIVAGNREEMEDVFILKELRWSTDFGKELVTIRFNSNFGDVIKRSSSNQSNNGPVNEEGPAGTQLEPSSKLNARQDDRVSIANNQFSTRWTLLLVVDALLA